MRHPNRTSVLSAMIDLRRLPALAPATAAHKAYRQAWKANSDAPEARILEIAELAYILEADGFPEPEIFKRIGVVFPPVPDLERLSLPGDPVRLHVIGHLSVYAPADPCSLTAVSCLGGFVKKRLCDVSVTVITLDC